MTLYATRAGGCPPAYLGPRGDRTPHAAFAALAPARPDGAEVEVFELAEDDGRPAVGYLVARPEPPAAWRSLDGGWTGFLDLAMTWLDRDAARRRMEPHHKLWAIVPLPA